jgi:hypothetical protein
VDGAAHTDQTSDLILLGLGLMHPRPRAALTRTQPAAVHLDDRHGGRLLLLGRQVAAAVTLRLLVTPPCQVVADFLSQTLHMPAGDLHVGADFQSDGHLLKGGQAAGQRDDACKQRGGVTMTVQTQGET